MKDLKIKQLYGEIKQMHESSFEDHDALIEEACRAELEKKQSEMKNIFENQVLSEIFDAELLPDNSWAIFTYSKDYISLAEVIFNNSAVIDSKSKRWYVPCSKKNALEFFKNTSILIGY